MQINISTAVINDNVAFFSGTVNVSLPQYTVPERVSLNSYKLYNVEGKKIIGWIMELVY